MAVQSRKWCFTLNNPTPVEIDAIKGLGALDGTEYLIFGHEVGESGTPHLQGYVVFVSRKRLTTVKGLIGDRAHLEKARGTHVQASEYCKKDGNFEEFGELPVEVSKGGSNQWDAFAEWVVAFHRDNSRNPTERDVAPAFPGILGRSRAGCLALIGDLLPPPRIQEGELRDWQVELGRDLSNDADDRTIRFIVDTAGGKGKSFFTRWYLTNHPDVTQLLSIGKIADVAFAIDPTKSVFLFNVPRHCMQYLQYPILESLKDRVIFSPKFASTVKLLHTTPHVVVLSNEEPDMTKMTDDRYVITYL